jgi:hypothetical protein
MNTSIIKAKVNQIELKIASLKEKATKLISLGKRDQANRIADEVAQYQKQEKIYNEKLRLLDKEPRSLEVAVNLNVQEQINKKNDRILKRQVRTTSRENERYAKRMMQGLMAN